MLEKGRIAHGSTSVTTSLLQYELDRNLLDLQEVTTSRNVIRAYELGVIALNEIEKFIPNAKIYVFDKCCHIPQIEHPDKFNKLVQKFLGGIS